MISSLIRRTWRISPMKRKEKEENEQYSPISRTNACTALFTYGFNKWVTISSTKLIIFTVEFVNDVLNSPPWFRQAWFFVPMFDFSRVVMFAACLIQRITRCLMDSNYIARLGVWFFTCLCGSLNGQLQQTILCFLKRKNYIGLQSWAWKA